MMYFDLYLSTQTNVMITVDAQNFLSTFADLNFISCFEKICFIIFWEKYEIRKSYVLLSFPFSMRSSLYLQTDKNEASLVQRRLQQQDLNVCQCEGAD